MMPLNAPALCQFDDWSVDSALSYWRWKVGQRLRARDGALVTVYAVHPFGYDIGGPYCLGGHSDLWFVHGAGAHLMYEEVAQ
jgi:hypothetical protein